MQVWTTTVDIYKMSFFDHRELLRVLLLENTCICTLPIVDLRPETYSEEPYFNFLMHFILSYCIHWFYTCLNASTVQMCSVNSKTQRYTASETFDVRHSSGI
ncbi:hypothetical protein BCV71DRAFT_235024 [Rhizopus microsporus]|uniref:Uncharacterized protein n=1 Tax=Rhizopus microsporus TaxID=58291 RepID=A0A1X0S2F2_RHIZD|nr:hypothetical protein BCV71DRAFT_235024 [Rhizopus microsporus]